MEHAIVAGPADAQVHESSSVEPVRPPPEKGRWPVRLLGLSIATFAATFGLLIVVQRAGETIGATGFGLSTALALSGVASAFVGLVAHFTKRRAGSLLLLFAALVGNGVMAFVGALATLLSVADFRRGRQIRRFGRVLLPPVSIGDTWALRRDALDVDAALRVALAGQWRENGRTEHASVAAFARLTLDLLALGAPPALVAAAQRDALDEIRHAERCFALARSIDGVAASPGPFTAVRGARPLAGTRSLALAQLAVDSLVDGALHEGVSARVIAQLARRTQVAAIREVLKELAADEGRHAAHGWDIVEWCVAAGGTPVLDALDGALRALPPAMRSPLPAAARDGAWERYGIHGHALEAEEYAKALRDISQRVRALRERSLAA